jgi:hypothetical protein
LLAKMLNLLKLVKVQSRLARPIHISTLKSKN